jgi:hypothetical protein
MEELKNGEKNLILEVGVPAIPEACKHKLFCASDITWVKTVNDKLTNSAYLPPDKRVITNADGVFFHLELNPRFIDSLNQVPMGDLILLYQRLNNQSVKCFTHLVTPIGDRVDPNPYARSFPMARQMGTSDRHDRKSGGKQYSYSIYPMADRGIHGGISRFTVSGGKNLENTPHPTFTRSAKCYVGQVSAVDAIREPFCGF